MAEQDKRLAEGYRFLDVETAESYRDYFRHITQRIGFIGDADLRRATREDLKNTRLIANQQIEDPQQFEEALDSLFGIVTGGPNHSLLAKVVATMGCVDIVAQRADVSPKIYKGLVDGFNNAVKNSTDQHDSIILSGALYSRILYHATSEERQMGEDIKILYGALGEAADSKEKEARKLGIETSARALSEMFRQNILEDMRLPVVTIIGGKSDTKESGSAATYPDKTMYLAIGKLADEKKLRQAAVWGMPDVSDVHLTRRLPRALIGIEVGSPQVKSGEVGSVSRVERKKLIHTYLRPLRFRDGSRESIFLESDKYLRDDNVRSQCSYDSLSYWLAVKVSRDLIKERTKKNGIELVNGWIDFLNEPWATYDNGDVVSIMGEAIGSYNKRFPDNQITREQVENHLRASAIGLIFRYEKGTKTVRREDEISALYKEHVWTNELDELDKVELAVADIGDKGSEFRYRFFPEDFQQAVAWYVEKRGELSDEVRDALLVYAEERVSGKLKLRFETIRNKEEPDDLLQIVLRNGVL